MSALAKAPLESELINALGSAAPLWSRILSTVEEVAGPIDTEWRPSKAEFGHLCLLRHKKRTLLYLTPEKGRVQVAIVLGERAYNLAMGSSLPAAIKKMFSEARPYSEGRGIRFPVSRPSDMTTIAKLVQIKLTPK